MSGRTRLTAGQLATFKASFKNSPLKDIAEDLHRGIALSQEQGEKLITTPHLPALGWLANRMRINYHGRITWYVINRHINYSNLCGEICLFCSFSRDTLTSDQAYEMDHKTILEKVRRDVSLGVREIHIVGGNHPDLPWEYYTGMLSGLHENFPEVGLKCFTAVEIHHFARRFDRSYREILTELKQAGLSSMPGGGAEIFAERVRNKICRTKATAEQWLEVHRTAHALEIPTNATLLYGTVETPAERVDHMLRLRKLQDETGG